jgi:hypothetical protein
MLIGNKNCRVSSQLSRIRKVQEVIEAHTRFGVSFLASLGFVATREATYNDNLLDIN